MRRKGTTSVLKSLNLQTPLRPGGPGATRRATQTITAAGLRFFAVCSLRSWDGKSQLISREILTARVLAGKAWGFLERPGSRNSYALSDLGKPPRCNPGAIGQDR